MNTQRTATRTRSDDTSSTSTVRVPQPRPLLTEEYVAEQQALIGQAVVDAPALDVPGTETPTVPAQKPSTIKRVFVGLAAAAVVTLGSLAGGEVFASILAPAAPTQSQTQGTETPAPAKAKAKTGLAAMPAKAEPTTVRGYERMFDKVSLDEWGGADVSISDRLPDGRIVWLYGDTLSYKNGFVNSTAIVQDGGNLHVSGGGTQVLPGDPPVNGRKRIYWIETMEVIGKNRISVTAMPMSIGTRDVWDFERWNPKSRVATLRVTQSGDVIFERWTGWTTAPVLPDEFIILGPNHFTYQPVIHEHIRLANGQYLKTVSQNWDDDFEDHIGPDGKMTLKDWRPIFSQVPNPADPDAL